MKDILGLYKSHLMNEKSVSVNTLECYMRDIKQYKAYVLNTEVSINAADQYIVQAYINSLQDEGISSATILRKLSSIGVFISFGQHKAKSPQTPQRIWKHPKQA